MPPVIQLVGAIAKDVVPIFKVVWGVLATDVIPAVEQVGSSIAKNMLPPIEGIISKVGPVLTPILQAVGWVLKNVVGPAISQTTGFIGGFLNIINTVLGALGNFLGMLGHIKDAVGSGIGAIQSVGHTLHIPGFAKGTAYAPGGRALVGEYGPELVDLPQGSAVHPTNSAPTQAALKGGGDTHYHVHVEGGGAPTINRIMTEFRRMELLHA